MINNNYQESGLIPMKMPEGLKLMRLPMMRQATCYTCGVSCVMSLLRYAGYDMDIREDVLAEKLHATEDFGTSYHNIEDFLNGAILVEKNGTGRRLFQAASKCGMTLEELKNEVDCGNPVVVAIQAWRDDETREYETDYDDGHYVIVIGYDTENLYFMDPSTGANYTYIPFEEFMMRWHDEDVEGHVDRFGMTVKVRADYSPEEIFPLR